MRLPEKTSITLLDELNTEVQILQSHLDGLVTCIRQNDIKQHRFQSLEMLLLSLNSLSELIEHVLENTETTFDLDYVILTLIDRKSEISRFLQDDGMSVEKTAGLILLEHDEGLRRLFGKSVQPYLASYHDGKLGSFFPDLVGHPASVAIVPLIRRGKFLGSLNLGSMEADRFSPTMATDFLQRLSCVLSVCLENTLNYELMRRTSLIDTLTNVNNRRFFDQRIHEEIDRAQRGGENLSCLFLDIDHFKSINDNFGHQMGDQVLAELARVIRGQLRNNDVLARYGGEEFIALLSNANQQKAIEAAERIRQCVERFQLSNKDESVITVTISIGVATFVGGTSNRKRRFDATQLVECADQALYEAKRSGRNKVVSGGVVDFAEVRKVI